MSADPPGLPCGAHSMYYRDSYRELFEFRLKLEKDDGLAVNDAEKPIAREQGKHSRGIIITGQSGIGKRHRKDLLWVAPPGRTSFTRATNSFATWNSRKRHISSYFLRRRSVQPRRPTGIKPAFP
ncbi:hypothetical protein BDD12DRAFT_170092 [Trichophaea hybrida]|nr:hypothetical protein BDD12DRAFT_170092 [Trichophaea hybrida]